MIKFTFKEVIQGVVFIRNYPCQNGLCVNEAVCKCRPTYIHVHIFSWLISKFYLQHSVWAPKGLASLISSHFKLRCRCLLKPEDSLVLKMMLILNTTISCHSHSSHFTEDLLLPSLNISYLPPLLSPSPVSTSPVLPWWSWHIISSCTSKNKQAVCQKRLMAVCQFY